MASKLFPISIPLSQEFVIGLALLALVLWIVSMPKKYSPINVKTGEDGLPGLEGGNITGSQAIAYRGLQSNESSADTPSGLLLG